MSRDQLFGDEWDVPVRVHRADPTPRGRARKSDPITSVLAASRISGSSEELVLATLRAYGPLTADEIAAHLPAQHPPTLVSATSRLLKRGVVAPAGGMRMSRRGVWQSVWQAA